MKDVQRDATLSAMKAAGAPLNRETYLYWAYAGNPPEGELDPEIEETLPPHFRRSALDELLTERIQ
jgi:hypothetical protein